MVNTTADGCPVRDPRYPAVWPSHMVPVNATLYTLTLLWVIIGAALLVWFRRKPYVYERGYTLQLVAGVAIIFEATVVYLRDAIGRDMFPCDAYLWLSTLPAPLFSASVWIRLFVHHNKGTFAERKFAANVDTLHQSMLESKQSPSKRNLQAMSINQSNRKLLRSITLAPAVSASINTIIKTGFVKTDAAAVVKSGDLASAKALAGEGFGVFILILILLPFLASIGYQYSNVSFYARGCVGCIQGFTETWIFLGAIIVIVLLGVGMLLYWRMYRDPDPLWILRELLWITLLAFVFTITAIIIDANNPAHIHTDGIISWGYLVVFGMSFGYGIQTYYTVYHGLVLDRQRQTARSLSTSMAYVNVTFDDVLADPAGRVAFENHLKTEFSIENLKFYDRVTAWEKAFDSSTDVERRDNAEMIYKTFIEPGVAPLEINISSGQRDPLVELFNLPPEKREIDVTVFSQAKREVYKLMSNDSFKRFKGTGPYTALSATVVASGDGQA